MFVVLSNNAALPNALLSLPLILLFKAPLPNALFLEPIVFAVNVWLPNALLFLPVVLLASDKKPNALKVAQKETYELINTVNALKDTLTTLSPVLLEGKKLMGIFENLKL